MNAIHKHRYLMDRSLLAMERGNVPVDIKNLIAEMREELEARPLSVRINFPKSEMLDMRTLSDWEADPFPMVYNACSIEITAPSGVYYIYEAILKSADAPYPSPEFFTEPI